MAELWERHISLYPIEFRYRCMRCGELTISPGSNSAWCAKCGTLHLSTEIESWVGDDMKEEIAKTVRLFLRNAYEAGRDGKGLKEDGKVEGFLGALSLQDVVIRGDSLGGSHSHLAEYFTVESLIE